jgi:hypothetical protein
MTYIACLTFWTGNISNQTTCVPDQGVMTALVSPVIARRLRRSNLQRITVPDKTRRLLRCARNDGLFLGFPNPLNAYQPVNRSFEDPSEKENHGQQKQ